MCVFIRCLLQPEFLSSTSLRTLTRKQGETTKGTGDNYHSQLESEFNEYNDHSETGSRNA